MSVFWSITFITAPQNVTDSTYNLPIVSCSFRIFCVLRHPNHFVLAGTNSRNVIITYQFLTAPVQANLDFFYIDCMTVYFNCKYLS